MYSLGSDQIVSIAINYNSQCHCVSVCNTFQNSVRRQKENIYSATIVLQLKGF